jgi:hypothetical protein
MPREFDMTQYVDVAQRVREFREKHPEGSLQPWDPSTPYTIISLGDKTFVVYTAAAYRTPTDERPGIGIAWEPFPGRTPYTRDSELMNAETSAWGRAIIAALASDSKTIASAEEVRNRQEPAPRGRRNNNSAMPTGTYEVTEEVAAFTPCPDDLRATLGTALKALSDDDAVWVKERWKESGWPAFGSERFTREHAVMALDLIGGSEERPF